MVTKTALDPRLVAERSVTFDVLGVAEGWKVLVEVDSNDPKSCERYLKHLDEETVRTWDRYGGTNLGTSRMNPFNPRNDRSGVLIDNIKKLGIAVRKELDRK